MAGDSRGARPLCTTPRDRRGDARGADSEAPARVDVQSGFYTIDYLTSALVEMKLHLATDRVIDPNAFERDVLVQLGAPEEVGMRYRMSH